MDVRKACEKNMLGSLFLVASPSYLGWQRDCFSRGINRKAAMFAVIGRKDVT